MTEICKTHLWSKAKDHPLLKHRKAGGIGEHLKAVVGITLSPWLAFLLIIDEKVVIPFRLDRSP